MKKHVFISLLCFSLSLQVGCAATQKQANQQDVQLQTRNKGLKFDDIMILNPSFFAVRQDGKWGIKNTKNEWEIAPQSKWIPFGANADYSLWSLQTNDDKWLTLSLTANAWQISEDDPEPLEEPVETINGLSYEAENIYTPEQVNAAIKQETEKLYEKGEYWEVEIQTLATAVRAQMSLEGMRVGVKKADGTWLIPPKFKNMMPFIGEKAFAQDSETKLWGMIDKKGEWVKVPYLKELEPLVSRSLTLADLEKILDQLLFFVSDGNQAGLINAQGEWIKKSRLKLDNHHESFESTVYASNNFLILKKVVYDQYQIQHIVSWTILSFSGEESPILKASDFIFKGFKSSDSLIEVHKTTDEAQYVGLMNLKGKLLTPLHYDAINSLPVTDRYWVAYQGKEGVIDTSGKWIIPAQYDAIEYLEASALFKFSDNQKYGLMNAAGKIIIPAQFDALYKTAQADLFEVKRDQDQGVINLRGEWVIPIGHWASEIKVSKNGILGLESGQEFIADENGKVLFDLEFDEVIPVTHNAFWVKSNGRWGISDRSGQWIVPPQYEGKPFRYNQFALLTDAKGQTLIDTQGGEKLTAARIYNAFDEYSYFINDEKRGLLDKDMNVVLPCVYDWIDPGIDSQSFIVRDSDGYSLINAQQENLLPTTYYDLFVFGSKNYLGASQQEAYWGVIDTQGNWVVSEQKMFRPKELDGTLEPLFEIADEKAIGLKTIQDKWLFPPIPGARSIWFFKPNELFRVELQGRFGVVNRKGEWVIPRAFNELGGLYDGLAYAEKEERKGYIRADGSWAFDTPIERGFDFSEGLAAAITEQGVGFLNPQGEWVIAPQFDPSIRHGDDYFFKQGKAGVVGSDGSGVIDRQGHLILPTRYRIGHDDEYNGYIRIVDNDSEHVGLLDHQFQMLLPPLFKDIDRLGDDSWLINEGLQGTVSYTKDVFSKLNKYTLLSHAPDYWRFIDPANPTQKTTGYTQIIENNDQTQALAFAVQQNGKWGFLNKQRDMQIPPQFLAVESFTQFGLAKVKTQDQIGLIDTQGKWVLKMNNQ